MEKIVGIDLGTTNSEISVLEDGKALLIPIENELIMPSCVGINANGDLVVGQKARNQLVSNPESTVLSIKRKMGMDVTVSLGERAFSPQEISSLILAKLKKEAEKYLGEKVEKAVITVPAYFDDSQRKATRDAGTLAGLDVVRIINEPTAAAVAYDSGHKENRKMLVYDLGGGTFDVSLVVVEDGVVEVKASHGDTKLGGDDFDQLLIDHVIRKFKQEHDIDLNEDIKARMRIRNVVEKAKMELSDNPFVKIKEEFITGDHHIDMEISRNEYEEMIRPLLRKTLDCINMCLRDANFISRDIDKIILVGGSTRTPLIHQIIKEEIGTEPHYEINPDLIVSMGASIQGGLIAGHKTDSILVDITPYSFGTSTLGEHNGQMTDDIFVPVVKRNTPLPVSKSEGFSTVADYQEAVEVNIYQGEEPLAVDNIFVGRFLIEGLSKVPAGNRIILNIGIDINGILKVTATEKSTGLSKEVIMDPKQAKSGIDLEEARKNISSILADEEVEYRDVTDEETSKDKTIVSAKELRKRAEKLLDSIDPDDAEEIRQLLSKSVTAINEHNLKELADINESLSDMIFYLED